MKLYLCMVMGGSICTILYIIFNGILPYEFGLKWKDRFLKMNILFHLVPIPWLAAQIRDGLLQLLEKAGIVFEQGKLKNRIDTNGIWESAIIRNKNNELIYWTGYQRWLPVLLTVSFVFCLLLLGWFITYLTVTRYYKKNIIYVGTKEYTEGIKTGIRKIRIGISSRIQCPAAIGIIQPIILLPVENETYADSVKGIIRHELNHILNMDGMFRFLLFAIIAMEWYNPLAYYLLRESITVSEMLCDEAAIEGMSKEEKTNYMKCIIEAVEKNARSESMIMNMGSGKKISKERMKRIMGKNKKKIWRKSLTAGIMILCFLVSSFPALAYEEPLECTDTQNESNTAEDWKDMDWMMVVPEKEIGIHSIEKIDFGNSDTVFMNQEGEVYSCEDFALSNQNQEKANCSHSYESGTVFKHFPNSDGSCKVIAYAAKICRKCSHTQVGEKESTHSFEVCPH